MAIFAIGMVVFFIGGGGFDESNGGQELASAYLR